LRKSRHKLQMSLKKLKITKPNNIKITMKNLEDFQCEKIETKNVTGGYTAIPYEQEPGWTYIYQGSRISEVIYDI
jgi:hypothetical protein